MLTLDLKRSPILGVVLGTATEALTRWLGGGAGVIMAVTTLVVACTALHVKVIRPLLRVARRIDHAVGGMVTLEHTELVMGEPLASSLMRVAHFEGLAQQTRLEMRKDMSGFKDEVRGDLAKMAETLARIEVHTG